MLRLSQLLLQLTLVFHFLFSVLLTKFIESIPDSQLVRQKLGCMCKMVESDLFRQPGKRVLEARKAHNDISHKMKEVGKKTSAPHYSRTQVCQVSSINGKCTV